MLKKFLYFISLLITTNLFPVEHGNSNEINILINKEDLVCASCKGNISRVKSLIEQGKSDYLKDSALVCAVIFNHVNYCGTIA